MIEYLQQLVEEKQYQKALDCAERLLLNTDNTSWDLMVIYVRLCQARYETGEYYGAQIAGQLAVKMAEENGAWDHYGVSTLWLGLCYHRLRQLENALSTWYDYIAHVPHYVEARKHQIMVLYNIGIIQALLGHYEESLRTLRTASNVANTSQDYRKQHGIRHALIDAHLQYGELKEVPPLLAKCAHYLRHNTTVNYYTQSRLWHLVLRVRFALSTRRPERAARIAKRGLRLAEGWPDVIYEMHMLLARVHEQLGDTGAALQEGVLARSTAMQARRFDLEFSAANYVYGLLTHSPDLLNSVRPVNLADWDPRVKDQWPMQNKGGTKDV